VEICAPELWLCSGGPGKLSMEKISMRKINLGFPVVLHRCFSTWITHQKGVQDYEMQGMIFIKLYGGERFYQARSGLSGVAGSRGKAELFLLGPYDNPAPFTIRSQKHMGAVQIFVSRNTPGTSNGIVQWFFQPGLR